MNKKIILISLVLLLFSTILYIFKVNTYEKELYENFAIEQKEIFTKKNNELKLFLNNIDIQLDSILENKSFRKYLQTNNKKENIEELFLTLIKHSKNTFQLRYIDLNGKENIRVDKKNMSSFIVSEDKLQSKKHRYYFTETINLKEGETWYSKIDLNIEHSKIEIPYRPTLRVAKAILFDGKRYGVLIANINMNDFLKEFISNELFDIFLLDKDGYVLVSNKHSYNWNRYLKNKNSYKTNNNLIITKRVLISSKEELLLVLNPKKSIMMELIVKEKFQTALYLFLISICILYVYHIFISRQELKKLNDELEYKVKEQTKKIELNLDILNKYVIYSKTDINGFITEASEAFCIISGYEKEELIGNYHNIVNHHDMPKSLFEELWKTIKSGKVWQGEIKNLRKDGGYYWTKAVITPEFDDKGNIISFMSIRYDITVNKDFEKQHIQLLEQSKMASLGEMIGNIAHQWRQPLSVISTATSGLQLNEEIKEKPDKKVEEYTNLILENTAFLSNTIDTFRNFVKEKKERKDVVVEDRIKIIVGILDARLKSHNIKLIQNISTEKLIISSIVGELAQVIINIVNNSIDALNSENKSDGWIKLEVLKKDKNVIISIEDNAGGIEKSIIDKIFEPYFTTKHKSQGTGLGLYLSYKIVCEDLNGNIHVKNTENGAKFFIELPLV